MRPSFITPSFPSHFIIILIPFFTHPPHILPIYTLQKSVLNSPSTGGPRSPLNPSSHLFIHTTGGPRSPLNPSSHLFIHTTGGPRSPLNPSYISKGSEGTCCPLNSLFMAISEKKILSFIEYHISLFFSFHFLLFFPFFSFHFLQIDFFSSHSFF
jgi:hypothetical protein